MNVIVSNKYQTLLSNVNIDVIKTVNGEFSVDELSVQFRNFFYNKMILDITALKDYEDIDTIQNLAVAFSDMSKIILLLDDSPQVNSKKFISSLVSMGIYNFTKNVDKIAFLVDNPNTYQDVAAFQNIDGNYENEDSGNKKFSKQEDIGNEYFGQRVIGVKNLTDHAGSTTLTYLLKTCLEKYYKVVAVEVESHDFVFFRGNNLDACSGVELKSYIQRHSIEEVILVDLNGRIGEELCTDIIYLIEPGTIPLNRLSHEDESIFMKLKDKKVVLNKSILSASEVPEFEREAGVKIFYNMPVVDDRSSDIKEISNLLSALGFTRIKDGGHSSGWSLFK